MQIADDHEDEGLQVLAVTDAPVDGTLEFVDRHALPFAVLADAGAVRAAWQIDVIWGSPTYLVDERGQVVAEELLTLSPTEFSALLAR